jgi:hypothetical protein
VAEHCCSSFQAHVSPVVVNHVHKWGNMNGAIIKVVVARMLGVGSAATTTLLWCIFLFFNPYSREGSTGGTYVIGALMILLALAAAWGSLTARSWVLVVAFVGSFMPIGLYMLGTPGVFAFIGVANVLYLIAAIVLITDR